MADDNTTRITDLADLLGDMQISGSIRPADAPQLTFGDSGEFDLSQIPLSFAATETGFGIEHTSGANPALDDFARFMSFSFYDQQAQADEITAHKNSAIDALLSNQTFADSAAHSAAKNKAAEQVNSLFIAMQQAGSDGMDFAASALAALESVEINSDDSLQDALEAEQRRRDLLIATAQEQDGDTVAGTVKPEKAVGRIDQALKNVDPAVENLFRDAASAGHITYNQEQVDLATILAKHEMMTYRDRWLLDLAEGRDSSYISTDVVYGAIGAAKGSYQTVASGLKVGYDEYQTQRADNDPNLSFGEWVTQELGNDSSEAFKAAAAELGEEGARQFDTQMNMISERQSYRILANTLEAGTKGNRYWAMQNNGWNLHRDLEDDLKAAIGEARYNELADKDGRIDIHEVVDLFNEDTRSMMSALTAAEYKGTPHYKHQVPVSLAAVRDGNTLASVLFEDGYPVSDTVSAKWRERGSLVDSYGGTAISPAIETNEIAAPPTISGGVDTTKERS